MTAAGHPSFAQRFWPVFAAGLVGVLSLPLMFPPTLDARLRAVAPTIPLGLLKALALVQPALLLAAGAAIGAALAHRLGLASHLAGINLRRRFVAELPLAIALGFATGAAIVAADRFLFRAETAAPPTDTARAIFEALIGGLLYGGLTEEAMMRWGLLSLFAWALVRLARRPLDVRLYRRNGRDAQRFASISEVVPQTFVIPMRQFSAAADFDPARLRTIRLVFDRTVAGTVIVESIGLSTPTDAAFLASMPPR